MYCPKCKSEYRDGVEVCPDCNEKLVPEIKEDTDKIEAMKPVKVKSAANAVEADIIMNLLRSNGIQCFKKDNGAGSYFNIIWGFSVFGEEIYVDEEDYQKAMEVIGSLSEDENEQKTKDDIIETEGDISSKDTAFYKNPRMIARIILGVMVGSSILIFILNHLL